MAEKNNNKKGNNSGKERWEQIKNSPNFRGVACNTNETYALAEMLILFDIANKKLRSGVFNRISINEAMPLFNAVNDSLIIFDETLQLIWNALKDGKTKDYSTPRVIDAIKKSHKLSEKSVQVIEELKALAPVDKKSKKKEVAEAS